MRCYFQQPPPPQRPKWNGPARLVKLRRRCRCRGTGLSVAKSGAATGLSLCPKQCPPTPVEIGHLATTRGTAFQVAARGPHLGPETKGEIILHPVQSVSRVCGIADGRTGPTVDLKLRPLSPRRKRVRVSPPAWERGSTVRTLAPLSPVGCNRAFCSGKATERGKVEPGQAQRLGQSRRIRAASWRADLALAG